MDFVAPRLPAPLHLLVALLRAKGLSIEDKLALARFSTTARWMGWQLNTDCSVTELLTRFDQTERLTQLMWRPLCIAALNTPPDRASAQVFLNVLRDSLGARRAASDMLIPRVNLSELFPKYAATFVERQGGTVLLGHTVNNIMKHDEGWQLNVSGNEATKQSGKYFDVVVVATQAEHAATLLSNWIDVAPLTALQYEPITTCYLQYGPSIRLPQAFYALIDDATDDSTTEHWGQFVFDRGALDAEQAGLLAVVVSASTDAIALGREALTAAIAAQLSEVFQWPELMQPKWGKVITEKRATFACSPGLVRPSNLTTHEGLVIAGDYTASDYPATLESAVRSGVSAAQAIL
jgi:squalene-associated FAD-dependent desaturase